MKRNRKYIITPADEPAGNVCPKCGQVNSQAYEEGAVEGPREYHADCWGKMTPKEQSEVWEYRIFD